jgi:hypothetical protein
MADGPGALQQCCGRGHGRHFDRIREFARAGLPQDVGNPIEIMRRARRIVERPSISASGTYSPRVAIPS